MYSRLTEDRLTEEAALPRISATMVGRAYRRFSGLALIIIALLVLQGGLVSFTFPIRELFTEKPLFLNDAAFHWYQMKVAVDLAKDGSLSGYDPLFNAGYVGGISSNPSAKLASAGAVLLHRWLDEISVYKLFSVIYAVLAPLFVPLGLYCLGFGGIHLVLGAAFS